MKVALYMVRNHRETAPVLTTINRLALMIGYSSARCECVFFKPLKDRCTTEKEAVVQTGNGLNIPPLMKIKFDDFLKVWESKPRKFSFV